MNKKNIDKKKNLWEYMEEEGLTSNDVSANCSGPNDRMEYGFKLGIEYSLRELKEGN